MPGKLYVVATPIGNLKDITYRAIEILKAVDFIACEDTRRARILLNHYLIQKPLTSLFEGNEARKAPELIERIRKGENAALISEAGTPNISDPGFRMVGAAIQNGIEVVTIPGASALVAALAVSGLPTDSFLFEGFLPPKRAARLKKMEAWKDERRTIIFYESPYRVRASLEDLKGLYGDVPVVLGRELTKKFEEVIRLPIGEVLEKYTNEEPRGEFVILLSLRKTKK